jgi:hypothetical protein
MSKKDRSADVERTRQMRQRKKEKGLVLRHVGKKWLWVERSSKK